MAIDFETRAWMKDSGWPFDLAAPAPALRPRADRVRLGPFAYAAPDGRLDGSVEPAVIQYSGRHRFGPAAHEELGRAANTTVILGANVVELASSPSGREVERVVVAALTGTRFVVRARTVVLASGGIENARLLLASDRVARGGIGNEHDLVGRYFMEHLYLDGAATLSVDGGVRSRRWP